MNIALLEAAWIDAERNGAVLDDGERGLGAFLHHVSELAGEDQPPGAGNPPRFDKQDIAADRRPGETGGHAWHAGPHRHLVLEPRRAENGQKVVTRNPDRTALPFRNPHRSVTQDLADLALKAAHAGFAGVTPDDIAQHVVADLDLAGLQPIRLELAAQQIK